MTITDYVWISIGQFTLAATFALGILVGISLRKGSENGNGNEGKEVGQHHAGNGITEGGACGRAAGGADATR
jgi:hypothetical protein